MPQTQSPMDVRTVDDSISMITIRGELSALAEDTLMDAYLKTCASAPQIPTAIILDFSQMEYMNSGGIGLLVTLLIRMNRNKQRLLAYGLSEHYQQIFAITRLDEAIRSFDTEAEALAGATRG